MDDWATGFLIIDAGAAVVFLCIWKLWLVMKNKPVPFRDRIRDALVRWAWK